jgi:hypothetical protein
MNGPVGPGPANTTGHPAASDEYTFEVKAYS